MDRERNFEKKGGRKEKDNIPKNSMALLGQHTLAIVVYCFAR